MVGRVLALLFGILVLGALIGAGGDIDLVVSGLTSPLSRPSARIASPAADQPAPPAGGEMSLVELKSASPAQLREYARAHPELVAGKSTTELISMYQKFKQSSE
jgi:hypothetical protein